MKRTITKVIKSIATSKLELNAKGTVTVQPRDKREFDWFLRALNLMGKISEETADKTTFELRNQIKTKNKTVDFVILSKAKIIENQQKQR